MEARAPQCVSTPFASSPARPDEAEWTQALQPMPILAGYRPTPPTASRWPEVVEPGLMRQVTRLSEMLRQIWLIISKKKKRLSTLVSKQDKL